MNSTTRRHFLRTCSAAAGAGLLQACGTGTTTTPQTKTTSTTAKAKTVQPKQPHPPRSGDNLLRVVAPSGFAEDPNRVTTGLTRLYNAGFTVTNQQAGSRRTNALPAAMPNAPPTSKTLPTAASKRLKS